MMLRCHVTSILRTLPSIRASGRNQGYITAINRGILNMEHSYPCKRKLERPNDPNQKRSLSTSQTVKMVTADTSQTSPGLITLCNAFGEHPAFNKMMYTDDHVLMTLHVQLQNAKYKHKMDVSMQGTTAVCNYEVDILGSVPLRGSVTGTNKKAAKKEAARRILERLDPPTTDEQADITKWIVCAHRKNVEAQEEQVSKSFGPHGHVITTRWTIGKQSFEGQGISNSLKMAELFALQDLYCRTQHLAPPTPAVPSVGSSAACSGESSSIGLNNPITSDELSKGDASQMNSMRNNLANKMKVKQQEDIKSVRGGFECTLLWTWTDSSGVMQQKMVTKMGTGKAMAKAAASKAMMIEVGAIDPVSPQESAEATNIRKLIPIDIEKATRSAAALMKESNCSVWRLFLPQLLEELVHRNDIKLIDPLLDVFDVTEANLPTDLWETFLSLSSISIDESFCKRLLVSIKNLSLDPRSFTSTKAMDYYKTNSWLISLEFNAEICSNIADIQERNGKDVPNILCNLNKAHLPHIFFTGVVTPGYLKNPLKEEDMVLVVPYEGQYRWHQGFLCTISKHKTEDKTATISCKIINKVNRETTEEIVHDGQFGLFHTANTTTNRRMLQAIHGITHRMLSNKSTANCYRYNNDIRKVILEGSGACSSENLENVVVRTNIPLTEAQHEACKSAIVNAITLIQGPPGTGKTQVACAVIDCWRRASSSKILAVADSNVAADNLIEALDRRGLTALRIGFGSESVLQEESLKGLPRYERYKALRAAGLHKEANTLWALMIAEAVQKHQIIIATCIGSGNDILTAYSFPYVVIDECAQSIEASNLIPIGRDCKQLVLIGDHKQLRPTIISMDASRQGLSISLLERLASYGSIPVHLLDVQRRMHPSISEFPNRQFYDGRIKDAVPVETRPPVKGFRWPNSAYNIAFIDAGSGHPNCQFESTLGTSKLNQLEMDIVLVLLRSFLDAGDVEESQIGVLTPYDAQKWSLRRKIQQSLGADGKMIEIDSVDGFQGKEKELIIFSAVRSNLQKDIGFLKDPRRMNVMLTRARRGLIIIADRHTVMNDYELWRPYLDYVMERGLEIHVSDLKRFLEKPCKELDNMLSKLAAVKFLAQGTPNQPEEARAEMRKLLDEAS